MCSWSSSNCSGGRGAKLIDPAVLNEGKRVDVLAVPLQRNLKKKKKVKRYGIIQYGLKLGGAVCPPLMAVGLYKDSVLSPILNVIFDEHNLGSSGVENIQVVDGRMLSAF